MSVSLVKDFARIRNNACAASDWLVADNDDWEADFIAQTGGYGTPPQAAVAPSSRSLPADCPTLVLADQVLQARVGISVRRVRRNLRTVLAAATPSQVKAGRTWYLLAQAIARNIDVTYCLPIGTGACLLAAYSPRTRWQDNVRYAWHMAAQVEAYGAGTGTLTAAAGCMSSNHKRAIAVIHASVMVGYGDRWASMVAALGNGPKVNAFAHNCQGRGVDMVTVDVWAMRAALAPNWKRGDDMVEAEQALNRKGVYSALSRAYIAEAELAGISPAELQAIVWCSISGYEG